MSVYLNSIEKFRYMAHKIMPLVFDESLSYYEFLAKVIAKLNEVIDNENEQNETITDTLNSFETEMNDWNEEAIERYNNFTAEIDVIINEFESRLSGVDNRIDEVEETTSSMSGEIDDLSGEIDDLTGEIEELSNELEEIIERYVEPPTVVQTTGESTEDVMSQKAVTDEFEKINDIMSADTTATKLGVNAGTGTGNTAVGRNALYENTTGEQNTAVGQSAGATITTGNYNTLIGYNSKTNDATNVSATAVGRNTTSGSQSVAVGAGANVTGSLSVGIGESSVASGSRSIAIGAKAKATHAGSTAIGCSTGNIGAQTTGTNQIVLGTASHKVSVPGYIDNPKIYEPIIYAYTPTTEFDEDIAPNITTWTGNNAYYSNDGWVVSAGGTISTNVEVYDNCDYLLSITVVNNTAYTPNDTPSQFQIDFGENTYTMFGSNDANWNFVVKSTTSGNIELKLGGLGWYGTIANVSLKAIAFYTSYGEWYGGNNKGIGMPGSSIYIGTGGKKGAVDNSANVAVGFEAQASNASGIGNVAIGKYAQQNITNGSHNVAVGEGAERYITTGMYNNGVGYSALASVTSGCWNVGVGNEAARNATTANNTVAVGRRALNNLTTGDRNVAVGAQAGFAYTQTGGTPTTAGAVVAGTDNTFVGFQSGGLSSSPSNSVGVGSKTRSQSHSVAIGYGALARNYGVAIGEGATNNGDNSIALGRNVTANTNEIVVGTASYTSVVIAGHKLIFNNDGTVTWTTP